MVWGSVHTGQGSVRKRPGLPSGGQIEGVGRVEMEWVRQRRQEEQESGLKQRGECERLEGEMILLHRGAGHRAPEGCGMSPASVENCP